MLDPQKKRIYFSLVWLLAAALIAGAQPVLAAPTSTGVERPLAYTGCGGVVTPAVNPAYEQELVERVNAERAKAGLPPLKRVDALDQAARYHAADLGQDNYFEHDTYDGANGAAWVCATKDRISSFYANWNVYAENIAAGQATPAAVMESWLASSGHRANILRAEVWEIGVGYYTGQGDYGVYWVQDFGRRSGEYPLIINGEATTTSSRAIQLYAYGSWSEMRVRINGGSWSGWQPFQNAFAWTLPDASGTYTVTIEMRSGATVKTASDTIYLFRAADFPERVYLPALTR
ncbi:MAG TPA: CAP domain-containing protein [Anaerolineaceae bacterium]|nr:CAP domain-containing protein [Anaerolineaceae bacterium]